MDIRDEEPTRSTSLFTKWGAVLVLLSLAFTFGTGIVYGIRIGAVSSVTILMSIGVITSNSWNRELKKDGYASLSQLYSSYIAVIFLFIAVFPVLSNLLGLTAGFALSGIISILYIVILNTAAFYDVGENDTAVSTYEGPSVVYIEDGPYLDHIEQLAIENSKSDNGDISDEQDDQEQQDETDQDSGGGTENGDSGDSPDE